MDYGTIINFLEFSLIVTISSYAVVFVITFLKLTSLNGDEYNAVIDFLNVRKSVMIHKNSLSKRLLYILSAIFVPAYGLGMNLLYIYYVLLYPGTQGLITGYINADKFSFINMVNYTIIDE